MGYGRLGMTELGGTNLVFVGTGGASPEIRMLKTETGTAALEFFSEGIRRMQIELATTENGAVRTYDSSGTLLSTTSVLNSTGQWQFPETVRIDGPLDHNGSTVGFYAVTPAARQTVTGSRGSNAALASLLTALATIGLVTDSSS